MKINECNIFEKANINLVITCLLFIVFSKPTFLVYKKQQSLITIFIPSSKGHEESINLQIDFLSKKLQLPQQYQDLDHFFLNRHAKNKIILNQLIQSDKQIQQLVIFGFEEFSKQYQGKKIKISGKVGLHQQGNVFMNLIKKSNHQIQIKLRIDYQNQDMQIMYQSCMHALKFPLFLQLSNGQKSQSLQISHLSSLFNPDLHFLSNLTQKHSNPFFLSSSQMNNLIKLNLNGHIKNIHLKDLIGRQFCNKIGSDRYQCQLDQKVLKIQEYGGLVFMFDMAICQDGIEIYKGDMETQDTYYYLHYLILLLFAILLLIYVKDDASIKIIRKLLTKKLKY